jgi:radical SAM protein with 4Fe4S-binding SPASM domain
LEAGEYANDRGLFYSNFLLVNFDEMVSINCRAQLPAPHLTPSGYVSSCDMVTDLAGGPLDDLIYGEYDPFNDMISYDTAKVEKIQSRNVFSIPECHGCEVKDFCAGGCVGEAINETGDFFGIKKNLCEATRYLSRKIPVNTGELFSYLHP